MLTDLPNLLTLSRIIIIPVLVGLFYLDGDGWRWVSVVLFTLAGVTDYVRRLPGAQMGQISAFGRFLDPIADKLLVAARHPHARGHPSRPGPEWCCRRW